jgi:hypothetical protein
MLVMGGMPLALGRGCATRDQAGLEGGSLGVQVWVCLSAGDAAGSDARVGAVEAKSDAADQCADVVLGKARVGADNADGRAVRALVDAVHEHGQVCDERPGVGLEDVFNGHVIRPLVFRWAVASLRVHTPHLEEARSHGAVSPAARAPEAIVCAPGAQQVAAMERSAIAIAGPLPRQTLTPTMKPVRGVTLAL